MSKEEFIQRKGAIELVFEIGQGATQFSALKDTLRISPTTISKRLKEGEEEGLWEEQLLRGPGNHKYRGYVVQDPGAELFELLREENLIPVIAERRQLEDEYEQKVEVVRELARDQE
jgi:DNA-binding HxlR family transcriptional regulator